MNVSKNIPAAPPIPGLEEAITKSQEARDVSPTGTPRVKPAAVPWLLASMVGAVAGLELCATAVPDETVQLACRIGAVTLVGVLGIVSPGWRRQ